MPTVDRFGFDDDERRTPLRPDSGKPDPQQTIGSRQNEPTCASPLQDMKLMP